MGVVLGIDFGTTNSVVSAVTNKNPVIIKNIEGGEITPSYISVSKDNNLLIGNSAKRQAIVNPDHTISSIKRFMGEKKKFKLGNDFFYPHEIAAKILKYLKDSAEKYFLSSISDAVITVPAYFSNKQRNVTKLAGKLAGLNVLRIINEPTAAALAYGYDNDFSGRIIVFDFGGGTFDVSILEVDEGVFEVISTYGNNFLGGDDFDFKILNLLCDDFKNKYNIDLKNDKMALQKIKEEAEKAKIKLSSENEVSINIPFITADEKGAKHLEYNLTREKFNKLTEDLIDETIKCTNQALSDANLKPEEIDKIIFIGGSTKIKRFRERIYEIMGKENDPEIDPMLCVAIGAAVQGEIISGTSNDLILVDVTPLTLGVEAKGGEMVPIIERNTTVPVRESKLFTTVRDNQDSVNVNVYQGESERCEHNTLIGSICLQNIPPQKKGKPRIEVIFDIDVDGILHISAINKETGKKQELTIEYPFMDNI